MGNTIWRTEPISVEKLLDDLRVETVICEIVEAMEYDTFTTFQDWENKTQEIIALQAKWKTIGYAWRASPFPGGHC